MQFFKTVFAILASVMLVGSQSVFSAQSVAPTKSKICGCCDCGKICCCLAPSNSTPQPVPAAPVQTVSQNTFQFIAALVSALLPTPEISAPKSSFAPFASPKIAAVPLYEWNCTYLI